MARKKSKRRSDPVLIPVTPNGLAESSSNARFLKIVDSHLHAVGGTWDSLLKMPISRVSKHMEANWRQGKSRPQLLQVNGIAVALSQLWQEHADAGIDRHNEREARPIAKLHVLIAELTAAAGYPPVNPARPTNLVYAARLSERKPLRAGMFDWEPLATQAETTGAWSGVAVDVLDLLGKLMGTHIEPVRVPWPNTKRSLLNGTVDLMAPLYLRLPAKLADVALSHPLPGFRCGVNGIISAEHRDRVFITAGDRGKSAIDPSKICFVVNKSGITQTLADILGQRIVTSSHTGSRAGLLIEELPHSSIESGWRDVIENPLTEDRRVRVFPTEELTCIVAKRNSGAKAAPLLSEGSEPLSLGVCLATHGDEPQLIAAINTAIDELGRQPRLLREIYERHGCRYSDEGATETSRR